MCRLSLIYELLLLKFKLFYIAPYSEFVSIDEINFYLNYLCTVQPDIIVIFECRV
jgi:hypothetical protein